MAKADEIIGSQERYVLIFRQSREFAQFDSETRLGGYRIIGNPAGLGRVEPETSQCFEAIFQASVTK